MTINTQRLRELAQKATPGHWYSKWPEERCTWVDVGNSRYPVAYTGYCFDDAPNAEHIAAANPATVLALLDEIDRLRAELTDMREDLSDARSGWEQASEELNDAAQCIANQAQTISRLQDIEAAARNLANVRGRHNSEIAMNQLLEALK